MNPLHIHGDTNTLPGNARKPTTKPNELAALELLWANKRLIWGKSHINDHEATRTSDPELRKRLVREVEERERLPYDEKVVGNNVLSDRYTHISTFILADVQDQETCDLLEKKGGLDPRDAQLIAQAIYEKNKCDVFLTCDEDTIIKRYRRAGLDKQFPRLKVLMPSELLKMLEEGTI
jgi:predicted nucleic acid-binding protein